MARIYTRVLELLGRLYDFPGSKSSPSTVDLISPVTVVHDVSRQAELALGKDWLVTARQTHVAAGILEDVMDVYGGGAGTPMNGYGVDADEWVWLMDCWAAITAGASVNFALAAISVSGYAAVDVGLHDGTPNAHPDKFIKFYDDSVGSSILIDGSASVDLTKTPTLIFPRTGAITFLSAETGDVGITVDFTAHIWVGQKGIYPPGLR